MQYCRNGALGLEALEAKTRAHKRFVCLHVGVNNKQPAVFPHPALP